MFRTRMGSTLLLHTHTRCDTYLLFGQSDELGLMGVVLELFVPILDTVTVLVEKCPMVMYKHIISTQYTAHNITLYNNAQVVHIH